MLKNTARSLTINRVASLKNNAEDDRLNRFYEIVKMTQHLGRIVDVGGRGKLVALVVAATLDQRQKEKIKEYQDIRPLRSFGTDNRLESNSTETYRVTVSLVNSYTLIKQPTQWEVM